MRGVRNNQQSSVENFHRQYIAALESKNVTDLKSLTARLFDSKNPESSKIKIANLAKAVFIHYLKSTTHSNDDKQEILSNFIDRMESSCKEYEISNILPVLKSSYKEAESDLQNKKSEEPAQTPSPDPSHTIAFALDRDAKVLPIKTLVNDGIFSVSEPLHSEYKEHVYFGNANTVYTLQGSNLRFKRNVIDNNLVQINSKDQEPLIINPTNLMAKMSLDNIIEDNSSKIISFDQEKNQYCYLNSNNKIERYNIDRFGNLSRDETSNNSANGKITSTKELLDKVTDRMLESSLSRSTKNTQNSR